MKTPMKVRGKTAPKKRVPFHPAPRDLSGPLEEAEQTRTSTRAERVQYDREERDALEVVQNAQERVEQKRAQADALKKRRRTPAHKTMHGVDNEGVHNSNSSARQADSRSEVDRDADHPRTWTRSTQLAAPTPRPGFRQKWVRYRARNENGSVTQDTDNLEKHIDEGWRPRKRDTVRRGHELTADPNDKFASCYVKRGLILMELSEDLAAQRNRAYQRRAERMTEGIDQNMFKINHPVMPFLQPTRRTRVARGQSLDELVADDE